MPSFCRLALPARRILVFVLSPPIFLDRNKQQTNKNGIGTKVYISGGEGWGGLLIHECIPSSNVYEHLLCVSSGVLGPEGATENPAQRCLQVARSPEGEGGGEEPDTSTVLLPRGLESTGPTGRATSVSRG